MKKVYVRVFAAVVIGLFGSIVGCAQARPDLIVRGAVITKDASGLFVDKITVVVMNTCSGTRAAASYVLVTFKTSSAQDAKAIYYIGNSVKALAGGESQVQTFDVADKKIGVGRHVFVEADPYKKVAEASEDNNWRTLFPDAQGTVLTQSQCKPKP